MALLSFHFSLWVSLSRLCVSSLPSGTSLVRSIDYGIPGDLWGSSCLSFAFFSLFVFSFCIVSSTSLALARTYGISPRTTADFIYTRALISMYTILTTDPYNAYHCLLDRRQSLTGIEKLRRGKWQTLIEDTDGTKLAKPTQ